jgi:hypothetical protein
MTDPSADRAGQRFHTLVATLERMLANQEGVAVTSPLRLLDKDTGRLREHDVVISRRTHHGIGLTALECRDQGRKVGVPQVEAFAKKCEKTGVHHGILVSASGFTGTARTKAKALNLTCMELAEAESFAWIGVVTIIFQFANFRSIDCSVHLQEEAGKTTYPISLHAADGAPSSEESIRSLILDRLPPEARPETGKQVFNGMAVVPMEGCYIIDAVGKRFAVRDITLTYELETEVKERPVTLHHYAGEEAVLEVASGQCDFPGCDSTFALVKSGDDVKGYVLSRGGAEHRFKIGDLPERRLPGMLVKS